MVSEQQSKLIRGLFHGFGGPELSKEEFLQQWGCSDGFQLGLDLLCDAARREDADQVEDALAVCFTFGFGPEHFPVLIELSDARWHRRHEDVIWALDSYQSPDAVEAFKTATTWIPDYLDYDESRALARKAIWALGKMDNPEGWAALEELAAGEDLLVTEAAQEQLSMRYS